ncbi:hypothetical protein G3M58_47850 [Streptomyces sp. SID7499]|uniref:Uncharacterized protein n=1 Tax=Streptomyces sp. SID7499 TaxID=2706086 RepID=A0A6G3X948_9ACTN|nr:hypothetical protein [Streptomyces sp. SID7499]
MQDAEHVQGDEPTEPTEPTRSVTPAEEAEPAGTAGKAAAEDLDWFEDVPEENVGAVLSLDETAPLPWI